MAKIFEFMNLGLHARNDEKARRFWVVIGGPVKLSNETWLYFRMDRRDEEYHLCVEVQQMDGILPLPTRDYELPDGTALDISRECGLMAVPRAIEKDTFGSPLRVLVEFIALDKKMRWVV